MKNRNVKKLMTHDEYDEFYGVKYSVLIFAEDQKGDSIDSQLLDNLSDDSLVESIGRIRWYENIKGSYKLRFIYDG